MASAMAPLPNPAREELNRLCAGKYINRVPDQKYRHQSTSGKLITPKIERKVHYVRGAYRADHKKAGNSPNVWGWTAPTPTKAAVRDR